MKLNPKRLPISTQLFLFQFMNITVMVSIILLSYYQIEGIMRNKSNEYIGSVLTQLTDNVNKKSIGIENFTSLIATTPTVSEFILEKDPVARYELYKKLDNFIVSTNNLQSGILDIELISRDGIVYSMSGGVTNRTAVPDLNFLGKSKPFFTPLTVYANRNSKVTCFAVGMSVYFLKDGGGTLDSIGSVVIYVDPAALGLTPDMWVGGSSTKAYMLDRSGFVYSTNDGEYLGKKLDWLEGDYARFAEPTDVSVRNVKSIVRTAAMPSLGGYAITVTPKNELLAQVWEIRRMALFVFALAAIAIFIPFFLIVNNILQPVRRMVRFMMSMKSGSLNHLKNRIKLDGYAEVSLLAHKFNGMMDEIDDLTRRMLDTKTRLYEMELSKKYAELNYLKNQINPHFLYNTLESIKSHANLQGASGVGDMAKALASIFRYSIKGGDYVILKQELDIVLAYLKIQQIRFEDKIAVITEVDPQLLVRPILKMIIQPIVENAVYHGLEPKMGNGTVILRASTNREGDLVVMIKDDGIGMSSETLERINDALSSRNESSLALTGGSSSIGLANVHHRIRYTYGPQYGLSCSSREGEGTEIIILLPGR